MSTTYVHYQAGVVLTKTEAWEAQAIQEFVQRRQTFWEIGSEEISIEGDLMVFEYIDAGDYLRWNEPRFCKQGEAECLTDILQNLIAKNALSLTYLYRWDSSGGNGAEDAPPVPNFEELFEQVPTLILQEALAKRLEE